MSTCSRDVCACLHFVPHKRLVTHCAGCGHSRPMHPSNEGRAVSPSPTHRVYSHLTRALGRSDSFNRILRVIKETRSALTPPVDKAEFGTPEVPSKRSKERMCEWTPKRNRLIGRKTGKDMGIQAEKGLKESISTKDSWVENAQIERILVRRKSPWRERSPYDQNTSRSHSPSARSPSPVNIPTHTKDRRSLNPRSISPLIKHLDVSSYVRKHQASVQSEYFPSPSPDRTARNENALQLEFQGFGHKNSVSGIVHLGDRLISVGLDYASAVWPLPIGSPVHSLHRTAESLIRIHKGQVRTVCVLGDDRLATGGKDEVIKIWDPGLRRKVGGLKTPLECTFTLIGIRPNSLISGGSKSILHLYDLARPDPVLSFNAEHTKSIFSICLQSPQTVLTGGGDGLLKLWDLRIQASATTFSGHTEKVNTVCVQGSQVLSGSDDCSIRVQDLRNVRNVSTVQKREPVTALAVAGDWVISGGMDLELRNGRGTEQMEKLHTGRVTCLHYFEPLRLLCAGSSDCSLSVWRLR